MGIFTLVENLCKTDSIFNINMNCFFGGNDDKDKSKAEFRLKIVKNEDITCELDLTDIRVSIFDKKLNLLTVPNKSALIKNIFVRGNIVNKHITDVMFSEVSTFYKNFIKSVIDNKKSLKIHILLNDVDILVVGEPMFDNTDEVVACHLFEIPFSATEVYNENEFN